MKTHDVVIAGGGPTGLMLAGELSLAGVDAVVVERRASQELVGSRAGGLHARTIEVLDQRGIAERFLAQGQAMQVAGFGLIMLDISDFPSRHPYGLALTQNKFEPILASWVEERGVPILRSREITGFTTDDAGVDVTLSDGSGLRAKYLVGCDGGRSFVRKQEGFDFPGKDASVTFLIAEASTKDDPPPGPRFTDQGVNGLAKLDGKRVKIVLAEPHLAKADDPSVDDLRAALVAIWGTDFGLHDVTWLSRFSDAARQASTYRKGRVLLAGDAAHIHSPAGGQGLNIGVQDAVNLGWKLAQVVRGTTPESLLDTYTTERHPIAARVLENTLAQTALMRGDDRSRALHAKYAELLKMDEARRAYGGMQSGLDVHYDLGAGHPLLGRRMPDLELSTGRVFSLLHEARPVLLNLGSTPLPATSAHVKRVDATYSGAWTLPVIGPVAAPSAVLVRPDGHVAWVGESTRAGLDAAIKTWFGGS